MINESNPDILANEWGKTAHDLVKVGRRVGQVACQSNAKRQVTMRVNPI